MDKKYAIFDMDGTLVDSMGYWARLSREYLGSKGVQTIPKEILERIAPMTMGESAALFVREFGLPGTAAEAEAEMNAMMEGHYRRDVPLKPGVRAYLERLREQGVRMCVASSTAEPLMEICLTRLGVRDCFEFLLSCDSVGAGKDRPDVYHAAAERLGGSPAETAVFEDAPFAAKTAKAAGYYVVAVRDGGDGTRWEKVKAAADEFISDWETATSFS